MITMWTLELIYLKAFVIKKKEKNSQHEQQGSQCGAVNYI